MASRSASSGSFVDVDLDEDRLATPPAPPGRRSPGRAACHHPHHSAPTRTRIGFCTFRDSSIPSASRACHARGALRLDGRFTLLTRFHHCDRGEAGPRAQRPRRLRSQAAPVPGRAPRPSAAARTNGGGEDLTGISLPLAGRDGPAMFDPGPVGVELELGTVVVVVAERCSSPGPGTASASRAGWHACPAGPWQLSQPMFVSAAGDLSRATPPREAVGRRMALPAVRVHLGPLPDERLPAPGMPRLLPTPGSPPLGTRVHSSVPTTRKSFRRFAPSGGTKLVWSAVKSTRNSSSRNVCRFAVCCFSSGIDSSSSTIRPSTPQPPSPDPAAREIFPCSSSSPQTVGPVFLSAMLYRVSPPVMRSTSGKLARERACSSSRR